MKNAGKKPCCSAANAPDQRMDVPPLADQYGDMKASEAKRLKELEDQNRKLKEIVADQQLDIKMLKHLSEGNW